MVDSVKPIHFGDDTQMDGYDGKAHVVLDNVMIIAPTPLTKGTKKETIVHGGNP